MRPTVKLLSNCNKFFRKYKNPNKTFFLLIIDTAVQESRQNSCQKHLAGTKGRTHLAAMQEKKF